MVNLKYTLFGSLYFMRMAELKNIKVKVLGFTLAEVLITLGIIGVVAAITIPGIMTKNKAHRLKSQYQKAYSEISQAIKMMKYDEISLDPKTYSSGNPFWKTFVTYFKTAHWCETAGNNKDLCFYSGDTSYVTLDGKSKPPWSRFDDGQFVLLDGALLMLENPYGSSNAPIWIHVDINGKNVKPNKLGYDVFTFFVLDEEIVPMGAPGTPYTDMDRYCNTEVTNQYNGFACSYKVMSDNDYFKKIVQKLK